MGTQGHSSASVSSDCVALFAEKAIVSPIELFQGTGEGRGPVHVWVHCSTLALFLRYVLTSVLHCLDDLYRILKF